MSYDIEANGASSR